MQQQADRQSSPAPAETIGGNCWQQGPHSNKRCTLCMHAEVHRAAYAEARVAWYLAMVFPKDRMHQMRFTRHVAGCLAGAVHGLASRTNPIAVASGGSHFRDPQHHVGSSSCRDCSKRRCTSFCCGATRIYRPICQPWQAHL